MKKFKTALLVVFAIINLSALYSQTTDAENCKDHPMFPSRMSNYILSECSSNFDAVEFNLAAGGTKTITKEGTKSVFRYDFNTESSQSKPSMLQILRNYEAAVVKIGGVSLFLNADEGAASLKITKTDKEIWVKLETGGDGGNDFYFLTILEIELMKQEIPSDDIYAGLTKDGYIALYLNFAVGKATLETTSDAQIDQIVQMMKNNPSIKISIEGHTDNDGIEKSNQTLSEERAKAVVTSMMSKGIDKSRLVSKGWGQSKPIADNRTEDGKAKNRRVEIVKL